MPVRVQRRRAKGWKMPANTVYVGRPSAFGNPFVGQWAAESFKMWVNDKRRTQYRAQVRHFLKGKNLACWCALDKPCHADTLLQIANGE